MSQTLKLVPQVGRVASMTVPLDRAEEARFERVMDKAFLIDLHEHGLVLPEDPSQISEYFRGTTYQWAYEAWRHGGWSAVCTANILTCMKTNAEASFAEFNDLVAEIGLMLADITKQNGAVVKVAHAADITAARERGQIALVPTVEHLAIGHDLHLVDVLYGIGVRLAGLTYSRQNYIGGGQYERGDGGLSDLGIEVVARMNDLGMVIDVSHAGKRTAMDTIEHSRAPVVFSHNAAHKLLPTRRTRDDEELVACAKKGGVIGISAANQFGDSPHQDVNLVLDHYDYLVKLVGVDHVAIGTDTIVGDAVGFQKHMNAQGGAFDYPAGPRPAPFLDGLESPADGKNIVRGLIARGYSDYDVAKIAGENVLRLFREVIG